ncbi:hypothetical protein H4Q26_016265 [Puccinia striiformis f. sp. tritici PST-130]|nr:hypothetical protein H4Q26_016265 [Puccinia striiformis f. sp. tritici PST-130]
MLSERFTDELEPRFHDDWTKFQLLITTVKIPFSPTSYPISSLHSFGFGDHVRASHSLIHWLFNNIELVHLQVTGHLGCKRRRARVPAGEPSLASRRETLRTRPYFVGDGRYARLPTRDDKRKCYSDHPAHWDSNSGTSAGLAGLHSPVPVAELYSSLDPLSNVDQDLSIPPPPYELIDPTSPITYHNANTNTQVISSHHHHRAPRGPRPLLNNRATSAFSTATTTAALFGSQHPPGSARTQPKSQSQTGGYHIQPVIKTRNKLAKYRPPPPNLIHRDKVNQVYQSPVYHPFSSTPNAPTSPTRPPLSNASFRSTSAPFLTKIHNDVVCLLHSKGPKAECQDEWSSTIEPIKPGPPPMITTRNDHHRAPAVLAGEEPSRTGLPKANQVQSAPPGRSAGRSAVLLASPASAPPSRAGQSARFICPECRCKPLPPSINRSLIRTPLCQSTRNINQTTYFT